MTTFGYHPEIIERFPSTVGGVILAHGLRNGPTPAPLHAQYMEEQQAVLQRIGTTPLSQLPSLAAWRSVFRGFGLEPTQYRSAAEALLRRLTRKGDIPSINTLVDIGNMVSIRYALPVAIFDTRHLQGAVTVRFADGTECYTTLNEQGIAHPEPGEVIFADETGLVIARRWCWRQSEPSAAQADTTDALITVEAHHANSERDIADALDNLLTLLQHYSGGQFHSGILNAQRRAISDEEQTQTS